MSYIANRFLNQKASISDATQSTLPSDYINLTIGDPDLNTSPLILEEANQDVLNKGYTHYTGNFGDSELIEEIASFMKDEFALNYSSNEIMITTSATHGMYIALQATVNPGDEILLADPYFDSYVHQIEAAGGKAVFIPTYEEDHFQIRKDILKQAITSKTRGIIINTPSNPTGAIYTKETLEMIGEIAEEHDLLIYADDIYTIFSFTYPFIPIASLGNLKKRTITLRSFSKDYCMTGFRIGALLAPSDIISVCGNLNGHIVYSAPSYSQRAALAALRHRHEIQPAITEEFKRRAVYTIERINEISYLSCLPLSGSIYILVNITKTGLTSNEFTTKLRDTYHIGVLSGSLFGKQSEGYVRIALTMPESIIKEAFDRLPKDVF